MGVDAISEVTEENEEDNHFGKSGDE